MAPGSPLSATQGAETQPDEEIPTPVETEPDQQVLRDAEAS